MNFSRMWLALVAAAWLPLAAAAAPAPVAVRTSQGPLADALRLRGLLPGTAPLLVLPAVMVEKGVIGLKFRPLVVIAVTRDVMVMVPRKRTVTETVQLPGGKVAQRTRLVTEYETRTEKMVEHVQRPGGKVEIMRVTVKSCKFFRVSKEGKLEALDAAKATALLKKRTAILTGDSAEVDPRHLTLVKPGTLYLVLPPPPPPPPVRG